jgi:2-phosphosulfolactate phosphatase
MSGLLAEVVIDCLPESLARYGEGWAIVGVDVIRATTTAVSEVAKGREVFPVPTLRAARERASQLEHPLLTGELGGAVPGGFEENNSPAALARRGDLERPMVLLSSSGTKLISRDRPFEAVYAACLRNWRAQVARLAGRHRRVAVIGAGSRGEFREEDQLACAWIAEGLIEAGYQPRGWTAEIVARWRGAPVAAITGGNSATYLRDSGQSADLDFVLGHVDDLDATFELAGHRLVMQRPGDDAEDLAAEAEAASAAGEEVVSA